MRIVTISIVALSGCGASHDQPDLEAFIAETRVRQQVAAHPPPPPIEPRPFAYRASDKRSPFAPSAAFGELDGMRGANSVVPDFERPRQPLELYPVGGIAMVGTLSGASGRYGLVRSSDAVVHRVGVGDYLGEDHGRIREIGAAAIELVEIVPDGAGGWVERARVMTLGAAPPGPETDRRQ